MKQPHTPEARIGAVQGCAPHGTPFAATVRLSRRAGVASLEPKGATVVLAKKNPSRPKPKRATRQTLNQVVIVISQELVQAKRLKRFPYEAQSTSQKLHTFWPPGGGQTSSALTGPRAPSDYTSMHPVRRPVVIPPKTSFRHGCNAVSGGMKPLLITSQTSLSALPCEPGHSNPVIYSVVRLNGSDKYLVKDGFYQSLKQRKRGRCTYLPGWVKNGF